MLASHFIMQKILKTCILRVNTKINNCYCFFKVILQWNWLFKTCSRHLKVNPWHCLLLFCSWGLGVRTESTLHILSKKGFNIVLGNYTVTEESNPRSRLGFQDLCCQNTVELTTSRTTSLETTPGDVPTSTSLWCLYTKKLGMYNRRMPWLSSREHRKTIFTELLWSK